MSDPGSSIPPVAVTPVLPLPVPETRPSSVILLSAPSEITQDLAEGKPIQLRGTVIRNNDDGSSTIRTPRGDVDIRPAEGQPPLRTGDRVEIDIVPRPPETAAPQTAPARGYETPVTVAVSESPKHETQPLATEYAAPVRPQQPAPVPPPPADGTIIRLIPLSPQELATAPLQVVVEIPASITPAVIEGGLAPAISLPQNAAAPYAPEGLVVIINIVSDPSYSPSKEENPTKNSSDMNDLKNGIASPLGRNDGKDSALAKIHFFDLSAPFSQNQYGGEARLFNGDSLAKQGNTTFATLPPLTLTLPILRHPSALITAQAGEPTIHQTTAFFSKPQPQQISFEGIRPAPAALLFSGENVILQNQKAGSDVAIITHITAEQRPIITLRDRIFMLPQPMAGVTPGDMIVFSAHTPPEITSLVTTQPSNTATTPLAAPFAVMIPPQTPWPLMDEVLQTLNLAAPQAAQALLAVTPSTAQPPAQMAPTMLFFMAALKTGDFSNWLGDKTMDILKRGGKESLGARLVQEGQNLARLSAEPLAQDWKALNLPLLHQNEFQKLALYYKNEHERDENGGIKGVKSTRFVFDLKLDAMGKVQLDGLYRPLAEGGKRLDLVIRTEMPFSQATQGEMRRVFARALRETVITGELSFQNQPEHWVKIAALKQTALGVEA